MVFQRKVIWIVKFDDDPAKNYQYAQDSGCTTVCVRTWSDKLEDAIETFHNMKKEVFAWRWPGADGTPGAPTKGPHYFIRDEANFVAQHLIDKGLDGYIVDPESNDDGDVNDWNRKVVAGNKLSDLAMEFWRIISTKVGARRFHYGMTSGCNFPKEKSILPWAQFIAPCAAIYPQCYWDVEAKNGVDVTHPFGATPAQTVALAMPIWQKVAAGKPIIPMAGETNHIAPDDVALFVAELNKLNATEAHFYIDHNSVDAAVLAKIKAIPTQPSIYDV
jgi:hypothetical protein